MIFHIEHESKVYMKINKQNIFMLENAFFIILQTEKSKMLPIYFLKLYSCQIFTIK